MELVLYAIVGAIGAAVAGVAGFGSATVMIPLIGLVTDLPVAMAVVAVYHGATNVSRFSLHFRHTQWRVVAVFGIPSLAAAYWGAAMVARIEVASFQAVFGVLLIAVAVLGFLGIRPGWSPRTPTLAAGGIASGFLAGFIGMGGAVRSLFLLLAGLPKEVYLATGAAIAVVVDASRIIAYAQADFITSTEIPYLAALVPAAFVGSWLGKRAVRRMPTVWFRRIVFSLLILAGLKYLLW